jgi:hypothetical protein
MFYAGRAGDAGRVMEDLLKYSRSEGRTRMVQLVPRPVRPSGRDKPGGAGAAGGEGGRCVASTVGSARCGLLLARARGCSKRALTGGDGGELSGSGESLMKPQERWMAREGQATRGEPWRFS